MKKSRYLSLKSPKDGWTDVKVFFRCGRIYVFNNADIELIKIGFILAKESVFFNSVEFIEKQGRKRP